MILFKNCYTCCGGKMAYLYPDGCPQCGGIKRVALIDDASLGKLIEYFFASDYELFYKFSEEEKDRKKLQEKQ